MGITCGSRNRAATCDSRRNRVWNSVSWPSESGNTLRATSRSRRVSRARQTSPIPPTPMISWSSYGPNRSGVILIVPSTVARDQAAVAGQPVEAPVVEWEGTVGGAPPGVNRFGHGPRHELADTGSSDGAIPAAPHSRRRPLRPGRARVGGAGDRGGRGRCAPQRRHAPARPPPAAGVGYRPLPQGRVDPPDRQPQAPAGPLPVPLRTVLGPDHRG